MSEADDARRTPLFDLHRELNGRIVDFAGWALPVRYDPGPLAEHLHTREAASLFDVSHMGIIDLVASAEADAAVALEALVPADVVGIESGKLRYTFFTNGDGGVVDDLIVGRAGETVTMVVNASRRDVDLGLLREGLSRHGVEPVLRDDLALLAVQGPEAVAAVRTLAPDVESLGFMEIAVIDVAGAPCRVSRSGYTGEDGVELQVPAERAVSVARSLLDLAPVEPAGLAARDSLRLEAGLCLYGNDLDETTTPIEAGLAWAIPGRRRAEGGYPGAEVIGAQLRDTPTRRRVGLRPEGRQPVRAGTELVLPSGVPAGVITSGGYGASVGGPIAMGYVHAELSAPETRLLALERGRELPVTVSSLPFVTRRYRRTRSSELFRKEP